MNVPFVRSLDLAIAWRYEKFDDDGSALLEDHRRASTT